VIGRTFLVLAALRVLEDAWGWMVWRLGDAEKVVRFFLPGGAGALVPIDAVIRHMGQIVAAQAAAAAAVGVVALQFLRLRPWARAALEAVCWVALSVVLAAAAVLAASAPRLEGRGAASVPFVLGAAVAVALLLAVTLWQLRTPAVRRAFAPKPLDQGGSS